MPTGVEEMSRHPNILAYQITCLLWDLDIKDWIVLAKIHQQMQHNAIGLGQDGDIALNYTVEQGQGHFPLLQETHLPNSADSPFLQMDYQNTYKRGDYTNT